MQHPSSLDLVYGTTFLRKPKFSPFNPISHGGAHWALEHWYVTPRPKWVISEPKGPKIIQFNTRSDHRSSKNVSKIYVLYLRDLL